MCPSSFSPDFGLSGTAATPARSAATTATAVSSEGVAHTATRPAPRHRAARASAAAASSAYVRDRSPNVSGLVARVRQSREECGHAVHSLAVGSVVPRRRGHPRSYTTSATTQLTLSGPPAPFAASTSARTASSGPALAVRSSRIRCSGTTAVSPSEHSR